MGLLQWVQREDWKREAWKRVHSPGEWRGKKQKACIHTQNLRLSYLSLEQLTLQTSSATQKPGFPLRSPEIPTDLSLPFSPHYCLLRNLEPTLNTSIHNPTTKTMSLQGSPVLLQGLQQKPLFKMFYHTLPICYLDQTT